MALEHFCYTLVEIKYQGDISILYAPPLLYHCSYPPRHTLHQIPANISRNLVPFLLCPLPKLQNPLRWCFIICKPSLEVMPKMFNGIEVRRLCRPLHDSHLMLFKPVLGFLAGVLGVIVLLKNDVLRIFTKPVNAFEQIILQNVHIELTIHPPINPAHFSNPIPWHTPPEHDMTTSKLDCTFYQPVIKTLPW